MKYLILPITFFFFAISYNQDSYTIENKFKPMYGFTVSGGYCSHFFQANSNFGISENGGPGYSLGFRTDLQFLPYLSLQMGLDISCYTTFLVKVSVVTPSGQPDPSIDFNYFQTQIYGYVAAIPLKVGLSLGKGKLRFHGAAGFIPSFSLFSHNLDKRWRPDGSTYVKGYIQPETGFGFLIFSTISAGLRYDSSNHFSFILEPNFKVLLNNSSAFPRRFYVGLDFVFLFGKK